MKACTHQLKPGPVTISGRCVYSPTAGSADVLWEASSVDTTATLSIGVPPDTEAGVAAGTEVEEAGDGVTPDFFGATTTLLKREQRNHHITDLY